MMRYPPKSLLRCTLLLATLACAAPAAMAGKTVVRLLFDGPILEAPAPDSDLAVLFTGKQSLTLREWVKKIDKAAADPEVVGIAMVLDQPRINLAQIQELRQALRRFQAKGKKVYCYTDYAGNGAYALASVADHITLAEHSELSILGLAAELSYYKGLMDKLGIKADMLHCGAYKSALEPFTRTEPSPEAAENVNWLLDGIYEAWLNMMAEGRHQSVEKIRAAVDQAPLFAEDALRLKLVDAIGSFDDFGKRLRKEFGQDVSVVKKYPRRDTPDLEIDPSNPFAFFTQMNQIMEELFGAKETEDQPGIGLVYISGAITTGASDTRPFSQSAAASANVRDALDDAAADENVKAVVVRVDSPGGSALGSDIMWKAARRLAAKKPLIVSMGGVAGSGGYYVSLPGDVIFANETTITGSIGVVGGKIVLGGLFEDKLGITTTEFKRGQHADLMSTNQPWSDEQRSLMQDLLNHVYDQFKGRVTESRGDKLKKDLESIAGGRVYTGRQALELGLIDRLGTLADAIDYAEDKVGLKNAPVYVFPKKKGFADIMAQLMGEPTNDEWDVALGGGVSADPLLRALRPLLGTLAPEKARTLLADFQQLMILKHERVGCFMPFDLRIH